MSFRTIYIIIASLLAALGFTWSIVMRFLVYAQYEVESELQLASRTMEQLPSLSVCYAYPDSLKESTVKEIWKSFPTEKDALDTSRTTIPSFTPERIHVRKYLKDRFMCYSFRYSDGMHGAGMGPGQAVPGVMGSFVLKPALNINNDNYTIVFLHDQAIPDVDAVAAFAGKNGLTRMTYGYQQSLLLPPPYVTNCVSYYMDDEYSSRRDCINKCMRREEKELLPYDYIADEPIDRKRIEGNSTRFTRHRCEGKCKPDCLQTHYIPRVLVQEAFPEDRIDLLYPQDHRLIQKFYPRISLTDLFTDIMELALFWILISPLPFVMMEKTILSLLRAEQEKRERRNDVRPYHNTGPAVTAVTPSVPAAGPPALVNGGHKINHLTTSLSMESRPVPPDIPTT